MKPPPLRVMVDLRGLEPGGVNGGLQTYVEWLLPWLRENHRADHRFAALARAHNFELAASLLDEADLVLVEGREHRVLREPSGGSPLVALSSLRPEILARRLGVTTLYCPLGPLAFRDDRLRSIVLIADLLHRELPDCLKPETVELRDNYIREAVRYATFIQTISRSALSRLEHHYPAARGKCFHTYLPVQSRLGRGGTVQSAARLPEKYFLYPANFWPHKNHRALLVAYQQYIDEAGDGSWDLVLCGSDYDGNLRELEKLADALGVGGKIHFPGYVTEAELAELWRRAAALVFPSLHEGFGIPLLEAMMMNLPVAAAHAYSLPEVAGDAAVYFNPRKPLQIASQMLEISRNESLRQQLVRKGRARLTEFDPARESSRLAMALSGHLPQATAGDLTPAGGGPP